MEEIMSLLGDLLKTASDAMRLSSDVIRYQMETKKRAVQRRVSRLGICIAMGLIALGFVGGRGIALMGRISGRLRTGPRSVGLIVALRRSCSRAC
jgi:hypothetical protein